METKDFSQVTSSVKANILVTRGGPAFSNYRDMDTSKMENHALECSMYQGVVRFTILKMLSVTIGQIGSANTFYFCH